MTNADNPFSVLVGSRSSCRSNCDLIDIIWWIQESDPALKSRRRHLPHARKACTVEPNSLPTVAVNYVRHLKRQLLHWQSYTQSLAEMISNFSQVNICHQWVTSCHFLTALKWYQISSLPWNGHLNQDLSVFTLLWHKNIKDPVGLTSKCDFIKSLLCK